MRYPRFAPWWDGLSDDEKAAFEILRVCEDLVNQGYLRTVASRLLAWAAERDSNG